MEYKKHAFFSRLNYLWKTLFRLPWLPLIRANTLESLYCVGYLIFLPCFIFVLYILKHFFNFLVSPLSYDHSWANALIQLLFFKIRLDPDTALDLSLFDFLVVLSIFVFFVSYIRNRIGKASVKLVLWIANRWVLVGEWLVFHRWTSLSFVFVLLTVQISVFLMFLQYKEDAAVLKKSFSTWYNSCEEAILYSSFDGRDFEEYNKISHQWTNDFREIYDKDLYIPSKHLNRCISILGKKSDSTSWEGYLKIALPEILKEYQDLQSYHETRRTKAKANSNSVDTSNHHSSDLIRLLIVRAQTRVAGDDCSYFSDISDSLYILDDVTYSGYRQAVANLRGTVLVCFASLSLDSSTRGNLNTDIIDQICPNPFRCFERALSYYEYAANESSFCSFEYKRWKNNELDLLVRLAMNIDSSKAIPNAFAPYNVWINKPKILADSLKSKARHLLQCNASEPIVPLMYFTAAQAEAVSGRLLSEAGLDSSESYRNAGILLSVSESYHPNDIGYWFLEPFCSGINDRNFQEGYGSLSVLTNSNPEQLLSVIESTCQ